MQLTYATPDGANLLDKIREKFSRFGREDALARDKWAQVQALRKQVQAAFDDVEWCGRKLLDVGCGQLMGNALILGVENAVTAIDMSLPFQFPFVEDVAISLRDCGVQRTVQTVVRQALGMDRRFRRALRRQLAIHTLPAIERYLMNAEELVFESNSFDGVYSFSVFQYIQRLDRAVREIHRVLKPGGVAYIQLHLYTSLGGSDHPLLWVDAQKFPAWGHLRASTPFYRKHGLPVNEVRLAQYQEIFEHVFAEVRYVFYAAEQESAKTSLTLPIRSELIQYSEQELLTSTVTIIAQKAMM